MEEAISVERPTAITVICVLMAVGVLATLGLFVASEQTTLLPGWFSPLLLTTAAAGLACTVGLWGMRKWAVFAYTGLSVAWQLVLVAGGTWTAGSLIIPGIIIAIMFSNLEKMR